MPEYDKLYRSDSKGKRRVWWMERNGAHYRMHAGLDGGKIVTSDWTRAFEKNLGRSNATRAEEQARLECESAYEKKRKEGYAAEGQEARHFVQPMLAIEWDKRLRFLEPQSVFYAQPKLDGIRCVATREGLFSRKGEPIVSCPHIERVAVKMLEQTPGLKALDGELYNHDLRDDFEEIASLVRKQKVTAEHFQETAGVIQYHVYDAIHEDASALFSKRFSNLAALASAWGWDWDFPMLNGSPILHLVETFGVNCMDDLEGLYDRFNGLGYEGMMVRLDKQYRPGPTRSPDLLKRKEFMEDEFEIVSVDEGTGNRSKMAGRFTLRLPDDRTFGAGLRGGVKRYKKYWEQREELPGQMATVRFRKYTADGVPLFPVVKDVGRPDA